MKVCNRCGKEKELLDFHKKKGGKFGVRSHCKSCTKVMSSDYYKNNKEKVDDFNRRWAQNNPEKIREMSKRSQRKRSLKGLNAANLARRRSRKSNATPSWLSKEDYDGMASVYKLAKKFGDLFGLCYHVDHIVPLNGENVCGLHVPWNLQVLESSLNLSKSNTDKPNLKLVYSNSKGLR